MVQWHSTSVRADMFTVPDHSVLSDFYYSQTCDWANSVQTTTAYKNAYIWKETSIIIEISLHVWHDASMLQVALMHQTIPFWYSYAHVHMCNVYINKF